MAEEMSYSEHQRFIELTSELGGTLQAYFNVGKNLVEKSRLVSKIKSLIKQGAAIDLMNGNSETLLAQSINNGDFEMAKILVELGADVNRKSVMVATAKNGNEEFADYLIEHGANNFNDGLVGAIMFNNQSMLDFFIELGANVSDRDVVEAAVATGRIELVRYLVGRGAEIDIYKTDRDEKTIIDKANEEIAEYLKENFSDEEDEDENE